VARRYQRVGAADLLLVVNHRTERAELQAWEALASEMGFRLAVWDLSLMGQIDLLEPVDGSSLLAQFSGKTIVVLNNTIATASGEARPAELFDKAQLLQAAEDQVSFAFVGEPTDLESLLVPTGGKPPQHEQEQQASAFLKALVKRTDADQLVALHDQVDVTSWKIFGGTPKEDHMQKAARDLQRKLARLYPDQRFTVIAHTAHELEKKVLFAKRWHVGTLEVRAMLPAAHGSIVSAAVDAEQLHDASWVASDDNLLTLFVTRSFDEKLARLRQLLAPAAALLASADAVEASSSAVRGAARRLQLLCDAIVVDLVTEQGAFLRETWRAGLSMRAMRDGLRWLNQLAAFVPERRIDPESVEGKQITRLVARLRFFVAAQLRFADWVPFLTPFRRAPRLWWITRKATNALLDNCFGRVGADENDELGNSYLKAAKVELKSHYKLLEEHYRDSEEVWTIQNDTASTRREFARKLTLLPVRRAGITTDAEVLDDWWMRNYDQPEYLRFEQRAAQRAKRRKQVAHASDAAERTLRREQSADSLRQRAG